MRDFIRFLDEFTTYLRVERRFSARTIEEYTLDLRIFNQFLVEQVGSISAKDINLPLLRRYLLFLEDKRANGPALRSRRVSSLRTFFNYLVSEGYLDNNPALRLGKPKKEKKIPVYLTVEECERFISVISTSCTHSLRNTTIIKLLVSTGMRVSEAAGLNLKDIDLTRQEVKVMGKGSKERIIPLTDSITSQLSRYIDSRADIKEEALFLTLVSGRYKRISVATIQDIFRKYSKAAEIKDKHLTPHKLRHTFATLLYQSDVDIVELQQLLGHSSIGTTQIYTHTSADRLKLAVEKMPVKEEQSNYFAD
ncbi:site-specific tyrosine recombinase/integron integrase [Desulforamulus aquiferis]|uniref:Tyrosine recombinase XerC n=1 Tax=Desulforamulus aquiferis TaxID=1397668 RepID=A0AAW7ZBQ5_9FIRM|nr:site-specific tyrosine recombinase/integron integrase [Desulforamulus aquiferis]MDO7786873.1 tyrosine recombinase XerC [Desulforamulus aquiferis]